MKNRPCFLLIATACLLISACDLSIGPRVETRFVILKPGQPGKILESATVQMSTLNDGEIATQDIGGWIAMPPDHWNMVVEAAMGPDVVERIPNDDGMD